MNCTQTKRLQSTVQVGVHQEGKETMIDLRGKSKAEVENLIAELLEKGYDYVIKGHWLFYFELLIG